MRIANAVFILYHEHTWLQRFFAPPAFVGPRAVEMRHPYVASSYGQAARVVAEESDGFLLCMAYLSPSLDHIDIIVCTIANIDKERHLLVFHLHHVDSSVSLLSGLGAGDLQLQSHVAVCMSHGETRFGCAVISVCWISAVAMTFYVDSRLKVGGRESCSVIYEL